MALNLTKFPKGLTSLFGIRDLGAMPNDLSRSLLGVIDVSEFYLLNDREMVTFTNIAAIGTGSNNFVEVVPPGELWYVWSFVVSIDPGAGASATYTLQVAADGFGFGFPLDRNDYEAVAALQFSRIASGPFWAPAGTIFSIHVKAQVLAPAALGRALVTKLRI